MCFLKYHRQREILTAQFGVAGLVLIAALDLLAAPPAVPRRAKRPGFPTSTVETFFSDAREKLHGERPGPRDRAAEKPPLGNAPPLATTASESWSKLISAETLEDEIKARVPKLTAAVENTTRFKSGEYQVARRELGILAALLGIVAEFDGRCRWKDEAAALRNQLGRASSNCKVASDAAFTEARTRAEELQLLVRGGSLPKSQQTGAVDWPQTANRALLMQRLEEAQQQMISPSIGSEKSFRDASESLIHEAEIIAALGEIITRTGYEFADDESYLEYARAMQDHAAALRAATLEGAYERARDSALQTGQSCTSCHEGYRS
jgi:hypothetical protein